jgi:SAM-dependent methyltransferase
MLGAIRGLIVRSRQKSKFRKQYEVLRHLESKTRSRFSLRSEDFFPCLDDATSNTGFDRHYVYHVAWAIRKVKEIAPSEHIDISSSLHFCAGLSAFIPVRFYDYRPALLELSDLSSCAADLHNLPFESNSVESLSCMHTVEHVGLGRYGDPIDYDGDLKAIGELKRVVRPGGSLLFVTPIGRSRIQFNAHRIYSYSQILEAFAGFELREFSLVPDSEKDGGLVENAPEEFADKQTYGCGCFWFVKK